MSRREHETHFTVWFMFTLEEEEEEEKEEKELQSGKAGNQTKVSASASYLTLPTHSLTHSLALLSARLQLSTGTVCVRTVPQASKSPPSQPKSKEQRAKNAEFSVSNSSSRRQTPTGSNLSC